MIKVMQAIRELDQLKRRLESQITEIQNELETISRTIKILEREIPGASPQMNFPVLSNTSSTSPLPGVGPKTQGLSDLCRQILRERWMSPAEVRDRLLDMGYHNTDKNKLLSSVYATLKRLAEKTKELETRKANGRTEFHMRSEVQIA